MSYAKGKIFNLVFLPLRYSAGDTYRGSGLVFSTLHYLDTDTALKVSQCVYCFTTSISHGVENYFPRLWGTGISDAIFII